MKRPTRDLAISLVVLLLSVGCGGDSGPTTVPVSGKVTQAGQPLAQALVVFHPKDSASTTLASQAETDDQGVYTLSTYLGGEDYKPGIQPGEYLISITKLEVVQDMRKQPKNLLPKKYSLPAKSGLSATVTEDGNNTFDFEIE
jgi:hypothetical protein